MATTAELMEPYFRRLEEAVLSIAPERVDELVSTIFKGKHWRLDARAGAPIAGINPFVAHPPDKKIEVTYGGLAMIWCLSVYAALALDLVVHVDGQQGGQVDVGPLFGPVQPFLDYATRLRTHDEDWPADLPTPVDGLPDEPYAKVERIFYGAVSWILLHEIAHVHLQHRDDLLPNEKKFFRKTTPIGSPPAGYSIASLRTMSAIFEYSLSAWRSLGCFFLNHAGAIRVIRPLLLA